MFFNNLILIIEFLFLKWKSFVINIVISTLLVLIVWYSDVKFDNDLYEKFTSNSINLLGILLGFTATIFTVILTIDNEIIRESKTVMLERRLYSREFSLYDSLVISFAFLIVLQGFLLILNFISPILILNFFTLRLFILADIHFIILMILLLVNSILEFYFIITKKISNHNE